MTKEEQKHTDLLPCPFCGGQPAKYLPNIEGDYVIECSHGDNEGAWLTVHGRSASEVLNAWATRKADCHEELLAEARDTLIECRSYLTRPIEHHESRVHGLQNAINTAVQNINQRLIARATNHQEG